MRSVLLSIVILAFNLVWGTGCLQEKPLTAHTGDPILLEQDPGGFSAMSEEEYHRAALQLAKFDKFVPIKRKPPNLTSDAKFGFNFVLGGHNLSWALDGDDKKGYVLYVDLNANGDLSDDRPLPFEQRDGKHILLFQTTLQDSEKGNKETYAVIAKLVVGQLTPPGQSEAKLSLLSYFGTLRRGIIQLGKQKVAFGLEGASGIYDHDYNNLFFDLNGDGQLDIDTPKSPERYQILEKYVNLGETSYEFIVDRYGRSLTLKPLAEKLSARAVLLPGHAAPDFSFTEINGQTHRLSDYRGKVVLLDFWGSWCGPCVAEAPELVDAYQRFHENRFEILGINTGDPEATLRKFISEKKMVWPQTMETEMGPLHKLYRVDRWPTYYLIGKDGTIIADKIKWPDFLKELEKHLE